MLCCASLRLRLRTLCAGSRSEALDGFVAEKLSQVLGDLIVNLFGTERPLVSLSYMTSGLIQCVTIAEVRHFLTFWICSRKVIPSVG